MQQTVVTDERKLRSIETKIVNYLASIAGRNSRRFCAPGLDRIRFAAAWGMSDEFIEARLTHLLAVGRIDRATEKVDGAVVDGYRVLPARLFERAKNPVASSDLDLTATDRSFLRSCGIVAE